MQPKTVFVIEDEKDIADLISFNLQSRGFEACVFQSGEEALIAIEAQTPDLFLIDRMLPGLDGLALCDQLRSLQRTSEVPIIMLTAKGTEEDVVGGFEAGVDDYITKPFSVKVLLSRIEAVIRRSSQKEGVEELKTKELGGLVLNAQRHEVFVDGKRVNLTQSEFKILELLLNKPGWVFTRGQIVDNIRGVGHAITDRAIDFQMVGLRKKIKPYGSLIETVRGVGYRFKDQGE